MCVYYADNVFLLTNYTLTVYFIRNAFIYRKFLRLLPFSLENQWSNAIKVID